MNGSRWRVAYRDSAVWRFVSAGTPELIRAIGRLFAPVDSDDMRVMRVIAGSALVRSGDAVLSAVGRAWRHSAWAPRLAGPGLDARSNAGMVLVAAALTHIGLSVLGVAAGWQRFIIPALAIAVGLVLIAAAPPRKTDRG